MMAATAVRLAATSQRGLRRFFSTDSTTPLIPPPPPSELSKGVFIAGLNKHTTTIKLREAFSRFGEVVKASVMTDRRLGTPMGTGYVKYTTPEEAAKGIEGMNGKFLDGFVIFARYTKNQRQPPERAVNYQAIRIHAGYFFNKVTKSKLIKGRLKFPGETPRGLTTSIRKARLAILMKKGFLKPRGKVENKLKQSGKERSSYSRKNPRSRLLSLFPPLKSLNRSGKKRSSYSMIKSSQVDHFDKNGSMQDSGMRPRGQVFINKLNQSSKERSSNSMSKSSQVDHFDKNGSLKDSGMRPRGQVFINKLNQSGKERISNSMSKSSQVDHFDKKSSLNNSGMRPTGKVENKLIQLGKEKSSNSRENPCGHLHSLFSPHKSLNVDSGVLTFNLSGKERSSNLGKSPFSHILSLFSPHKSLNQSSNERSSNLISKSRQVGHSDKKVSLENSGKKPEGIVVMNKLNRSGKERSSTSMSKSSQVDHSNKKGSLQNSGKRAMGKVENKLNQSGKEKSSNSRENPYSLFHSLFTPDKLVHRSSHERSSNSVRKSSQVGHSDKKVS